MISDVPFTGIGVRPGVGGSVPVTLDMNGVKELVDDPINERRDDPNSGCQPE